MLSDQFSFKFITGIKREHKICDVMNKVCNEITIMKYNKKLDFIFAALY